MKQQQQKPGGRERGRLGQVERVPASKDRQWCCSPMLTSTLPEQFGNWLSSLSWSRERKRSVEGKTSMDRDDRGKRKDRKCGTERWRRRSQKYREKEGDKHKQKA